MKGLYDTIEIKYNKNVININKENFQKILQLIFDDFEEYYNIKEQIDKYIQENNKQENNKQQNDNKQIDKYKQENNKKQENKNKEINEQKTDINEKLNEFYDILYSYEKDLNINTKFMKKN